MTIALVDKHPLILSGLHQFISEEFKDAKIVEADSVTSLQGKFRYNMPELFILGFGQNTDDENASFISRAKNKHAVKTIVFDDHPDHSRAKYYLQTGANGYISKQDQLSDLSLCIKKVLKGERYVCPEIFVLMEKNQNISIQLSGILSTREYEIAKYLSEGMRTSSIAETLGRKASTISTIKNNIFKKLKVDNILQLRKTLAVC